MNKALNEKKINILHAWVSLRKMANICQETELQINTVDSLYVFFFPSPLSSNQTFFPTSTPQPPFPCGRQWLLCTIATRRFSFFSPGHGAAGGKHMT